MGTKWAHKSQKGSRICIICLDMAPVKDMLPPYIAESIIPLSSSSNRMILQASCSNAFRAFVDSGLPEKTFSADGKNIKCSPFRDAFFVFCIICRELCPFPVSSVWKHLIRIPECLNVPSGRVNRGLPALRQSRKNGFSSARLPCLL